MKILFVHQNFPGQFKHLAPALKKRGHEVRALTINANWLPEGVDVIQYRPTRFNTKGIHPWLLDMESKLIRGQAAFEAAMILKRDGWYPDAIIAHPGWGESLFLKDVWPNAKLGLYAEFYYSAVGNDIGFDPEFENKACDEVCRIRMKNVNHDIQLVHADKLISPTQYQRSVFPSHIKDKIDVVHDGIDTEHLIPDSSAELFLNGNLRISRDDEIITFVNRNLEPMRGFHVFMRALSKILNERKNARVIIVGGDDVSYGTPPNGGGSWKQQLLAEVGKSLDMSRVHFVGKLPYQNYVKLLQISSVHIYLTYPFVLSWSVLEAMSIGCAIVASNTSPVLEAIEHGKTGLLVDFFDVDALSSSVVELLESPEKREKLSAAARNHAIQHYDLRTVCLPKQLEWFDQLAGITN